MGVKIVRTVKPSQTGRFFIGEKHVKRTNIFLDTTLRDGEQTPGNQLRVKEKPVIAAQLARAGVPIIEAGFPANSKMEELAVAQIAQEVREPVICALARALPDDIDAAWRAVRYARHPRIHVFISSSDIQQMHQLRKDRDEVIRMAVAGVRRAKSYCEDVEFSPMDATRSEQKYLFRLLREVIEAGATTVNIPDTVGDAEPDEFAQLIENIRERVPNIGKAIISVHCHNDLGLATSNSWKAVKAGARQVEVCVNGLGERAGNASLEEMVMVIDRHAHDWAQTGIDKTQLIPLSRHVARAARIRPQPNKAIIGENAFRHQSGIHQDGVLKNQATYEIIDPQTVGRPEGEPRIVIGKVSGKAGIAAKINELGYIGLDETQFEKVYSAIRRITDRGVSLTDTQVKRIIAKALPLF